MEALKRKPAPGGGAGDFQNRKTQSENTLAGGEFQALGGAAGAIVASLSYRREKWIARRCRVAPAVARALASVVFPEVTK